MTGVALIAIMTALATPTAQGPVRVECSPTFPINDRAGWATPWDKPIPSVTLDPETCATIKMTIRHKAAEPILAPGERRVPLAPVYVTDGLMVLLHEARHVGQWREGETFTDPARRFEHNAECGALRALPRALKILGYAPWVRRYSIREQRRLIRFEPETEYAGTCPLHARAK